VQAKISALLYTIASQKKLGLPLPSGLSLKIGAVNKTHLTKNLPIKKIGR